MLFNSLGYALFLPVVFFIYWLVTNKNLTLQNTFLLAASYYFYACWDWRFLFLLLFSTFLDYCSGLQISAARGSRQRKDWFWLSVAVNLGFLGLFKYYNFFAASFAQGIAHLGFRIDTWTLNLILP